VRRTVAVLGALGLGLGGCGAEEEALPAAVELRPVEAGGPVGLAAVGQVDGKVRGPLAVWGLGAGSRHRVEVGEACGPRKTASPPGEPRPEDSSAPEGVPSSEIVAGPNGVAFGRLAAPTPPGDRLSVTVFSRGGGAQGNPRVTCGEAPLRAQGLAPEPLRPRELALVGPGAAVEADVSSLIQLRDGVPLGGTQTITATAGDRVALGVRSYVPDELVLEGLGLTVQAGPGVISRFSIVVEEPGRYPIRARSAGGRPVAVLAVSR